MEILNNLTTLNVMDAGDRSDDKDADSVLCIVPHNVAVLASRISKRNNGGKTAEILSRLIKEGR